MAAPYLPFPLRVSPRVLRGDEVNTCTLLPHYLTSNDACFLLLATGNLRYEVSAQQRPQVHSVHPNIQLMTYLAQRYGTTTLLTLQSNRHSGYLLPDILYR